jgi:signal transduction histidine kinase
MSHLLRYGMLAALLAVCCSAPYVLPFRAAHALLATGAGGVIAAVPALGTAAPAIEVGWYVTLGLSTTWLFALIWTLSHDLPLLERRFPRQRALVWFAVGAAGALAWLVDRWLFPNVCVACVLLNVDAPAVKVHHNLLLQTGTALLVPPLGVACAKVLGRRLDASKLPLSVWLATICAVLFVTPPYLVLAKAGQFTLLALGTVAFWLRELPALEQGSRLGKWRFRACLLALGILPLVPARPLVKHWLATQGAASLPLLNAYATVLAGSCGLAFVVACLSTAEGLSWLLRGARSLRTRLLVFGLCCAALAFVLDRVRIPVHVMGEGAALAEVLSLLTKFVGAAAIVFSFSLVLSRELVQSLQRSAQAIVEISHGNLDVELAETGRDEVAAVAESVNRMLGQLREAEFLEGINADLRARSEALARALEKLRETQVELVRSERMASVATLVKGIAHELNNPINYIAGNVAPLRRYSAFLARAALELADGRSRSAEELRSLTALAPGKDLAFVVRDLDRLTEDLGEGARRASLIIGDLQNLTTVSRREVELIDLGRAVRQTVAVFAPRLPEGVCLEVLACELPPFRARAGELEQVLLSLVDNAVRAVGARGTVRISGRLLDGHVELAVEDDGPGLSEAVKARVFEPFFTTRAPGEGSGLGLAIVASIVRAHGGVVAVESEPGRGARFSVRLPTAGACEPTEGGPDDASRNAVASPG